MARIKENVLRDYVGERVSRARKMLGISQVNLADRIGVTDKTIYNIEKGRNDVSFLILMKIAVTLCVPIECFVPALKQTQPIEFLEKL